MWVNFSINLGIELSISLQFWKSKWRITQSLIWFQLFPSPNIFIWLGGCCTRFCIWSRVCCLGDDGDIDYAFMPCPLAKLVWFSSPLGINFDNVEDDFCTWLEKIIMQDQQEVTELILFLCYSLWWARNRKSLNWKIYQWKWLWKKSYGMVTEYKCNTQTGIVGI